MVRIDTPKPAREKRCENCACYDLGDRQCHANYPVAVPVPAPNGQLGAIGMFVPVPPDSWCRKWEAQLS